MSLPWDGKRVGRRNRSGRSLSRLTVLFKEEDRVGSDARKFISLLW